jgi:hypothetical protein
MKIRQLLLPATVCAMLLASPALAGHGGNTGGSPNENADAGQAIQFAKCGATIGRQIAMDVTGADTGSDKDPKHYDSAVTNCDQWWSPPAAQPQP